jgi:collagenase-like PrtC family protease
VEPSAAIGLKRGDGVVVDCGPDHTQDEVGGSLYDVEELSDGHVLITFGRDVASKPWLSEGALLWRTSDSIVDAKLKKLASSSKVKRTAVDVTVSIVEGHLEIKLSDGRHNVTTRTPVEPADGQPLTTATIVKAIGSLGDTPWRIGPVEVGLEGDWWCPLGDIKQARREAVEALRRLRAPAKRINKPTYGAARTKRNAAGADGELRDDDLLFAKTAADPRVSVLVRDPAQCGAVCEFAAQNDLVDEVVLDFLEMTNYEHSIAAARAAGLRAVVAAPCISMPGERALDGLIALRPDALLARSPGQLQSLNRGNDGIEIRGDFSLNAANAVSFAEYADEGLERLTPAHDLSGAAIAALARALSPARRSKLEPVLHQHLPIFHSSHCLYARYLSKGDSFADCGHVCERHKIHLKDEQGQDHLVLADMGCRNTVFNAQAQSGADALEAWLDEGISRYRVEFVDESASGVRNVLSAYSDLFAARGRAPEPLWSLLAGVEDSNGNPQGAGVGSLRVEAERKAGKGRKTTGQRRSKVVRRASDKKSRPNSRRKTAKSR